MSYPWNNPPIWHAMNVHMPVVLALLGLPLVCIVAITRGRNRSLRWGVVVFYAVVALSAWWAVRTGEGARAMLSPSISREASERIDFHESMAQMLPLFGAATALLLLLANLPRRWARQLFTTLGLVVSVTMVIWVMVTAHSGGLAVYENGLGTVAMQNRSPDRKIGGSDVTAVSALPTSKTPDLAIGATINSSTKLVSFSRDIKPLLIAKCAECHADKEIKSGFDISNVASIAKGGKKAGAGFIAGKPDDSAIIQYIEGKKQPQMPKGGKALEAKDIALIKAWIADGAADDSNGKIASAAPSPAAPAATTEPISPDWDPQVQFDPAESVAVRRYVRLKNLPAAPGDS